MSTMPAWRICRKCGRPYSYDPSVGEYGCPDCLMRKKTILEKVKSLCRRGKGK